MYNTTDPEEFRLPVRDTLLDVFKFLWTARRDLLLMAAIPVVGLTIYQVAMTDLFGVVNPAAPVTAGPPATLSAVLILYLPSLVLYIMFAVAWHRRYLMRGESSTVWSALRWDPIKLKFLLNFLLISLVAGAVVAVPIVMLTIFGVVLNFAAAAATEASPPVDVNTLSSVIGMAAGIMTMIVYLRLSLWLPATAVDAPVSLLESWRLGRGNSLRIFIVACGAEIGLWIFAVIFNFAVGSLPTGSIALHLIAALIENSLAYAVLAAGISAISICYERLQARIANDPLYSGMPFMD
ncbi:MAG: hypothetical protein ACPGQV_07185 [Alphaproteobacteria bacterium]